MTQSQRTESFAKIVFVISLCAGYAYVILAALYMAHMWPL